MFVRSLASTSGILLLTQLEHRARCDASARLSSLSASSRAERRRYKGAHPVGSRGTHPNRVRRKNQRYTHQTEASADGTLGVLDLYESAVTASPLLTKSVTSLLGFAIADLVAQRLSKGNSASMSWDLARTGRIGLFGLLFYGPASGYWYGFLDSYVLPDQSTSALAVAIKTGADQLIWAPILITALFSWDLAWSEEQDISNLPNKLRQDLLGTLLVNWTFWPAFHLINFRFVSPIDRVLYINVVQVFFNVFLCWQAAKQLGEEADEGASD